MIPGLGRSTGEGIGYPLQYSWASLVAQLVKNLPAMWETWVRSLGWEDPLEKGKGYPLQYSGLENSMDCIVHGVAKSWTGLSDFHFHFPERIDADCPRKVTNGSMGKMESKETVFLPFPCTLGARVELLF